MKNTTITLGETAYVVRHLNLGEIEEIDEVVEEPAGLKRSYRMLEVILRRAQPKIEDVRAIEAAPREIAEAITHVLKFSGLQEETAPNGTAPGEPAPSGPTSTDESKPTAARHHHKSEK